MRVEPDGAAAEAGVRVGDIIVALDQQTIESPSHLAEVVGQIEGDSAVPMRIQRDGHSLFVALRFEQPDEDE